MIIPITGGDGENFILCVGGLSLTLKAYLLTTSFENNCECLKAFLKMFGNIPRNITLPPFPALPAFCSPFLFFYLVLCIA